MTIWAMRTAPKLKRQSDNENLMRLQKEALAGDSFAWSELWRCSLQICKKIAISEVRKNGLYTYCFDDIEDIASKSVCSVLARYRKKGGYIVKDNFVGVLYWAVFGSLYRQTKADVTLKKMYEELNANKAKYTMLAC